VMTHPSFVDTVIGTSRVRSLMPYASRLRAKAAVLKGSRNWLAWAELAKPLRT
jgi:hypothetical protein